MRYGAVTRSCNNRLRIAVGVCTVVMSCAVLAAPPQVRPWGQSVTDEVETYHRDPGPRRYNPWEKFRNQADRKRDAAQAEHVAPRYREKKKLSYQERKLPQFYDGRGVPSGSYPYPVPGYYPYNWGGTGAPMQWGYPYQMMYPGLGYPQWGYGGW